MKAKLINPLLWLCIICLILNFVACDRQPKYVPSRYTMDEVLSLYTTNTDLFENVVDIISSNDEFYEKGRINEHTDADIISPHDEALSYFSDIDRSRIDELFELKPYMILYDYGRRFVSFTFIASDDTVESYVLLFWTLDSENSEEKFNDYKVYLSQRRVLERLTDRCIMYYNKH